MADDGSPAAQVRHAHERLLEHPEVWTDDELHEVRHAAEDLANTAESLQEERRG